MSGTQPSIAEVAALVGNPARANILSVLLDGRALTATELAHIGGVSPQTASGHLSKLTEGGLLLVHKQGRHSYFRLASSLIGQMLEGIMAVAAEDLRRAIGRSGAATRRCVSPAPATTILPGGSTWRWPMPSSSADMSCLVRTAG
jgi:DNA-binding transcriptional ArsR family regulator